ncbi:MAG: hypothetical protein ACI379_04210 [Nocardioides sp.]|uniref:hypothetical protein n=1 Tax=Nocardioides sp. TaxID=35761 RepID=UPI003F0CA7F3
MYTLSQDTEQSRRERLRDRNVRGLVELLSRRGELRGVHPMADHVVDTFAWTV